MDLLIRSNGSTHQRRQTSAGKPRVKSMSTSYFSSGKNAVRDLSASNLRDFSTVKIFFSARAWMNGSTTSDAAAVKSTVRQHKSKSPAAMILLSTKIVRMVLRPSSISVAAGRAFLRNPAVSDGDTDAADSTPADCTATLFALRSEERRGGREWSSDVCSSDLVNLRCRRARLFAKSRRVGRRHRRRRFHACGLHRHVVRLVLNLLERRLRSEE